MSRLDDPHDVYSGDQTIYSGYVMTDIPFNLFDQQFRLSGGIRLENSEQLVHTISAEETNKEYIARVKNIDVLPSMNFTFVITPASNIRFAYSHSVNRPEFRELSSFYFYDYAILEGNYGNPHLRRALINNYDVRYELFPGVGEVFAISYFYKNLSDPIEQKMLVSSNPERTWFNSPHGTNFGWEIEMRKALDFLPGPLANLSITGNYTRIYSAIDYNVVYTVVAPDGTLQAATKTLNREMQGQSPYIINFSLMYREPSSQTTVNLLYNEFGRKLDAVGDVRVEDIMENARSVLDLTITQLILNNLELKFSAKDIQGKARVFETRNGENYRTINMGTTYSVQVSVTL